MRPTGLTISDVAGRTGLSEGTLRIWESRYGFPEPERLPSGHRRYSERDVATLLLAVRERDAGVSIKAALERARAAAEQPEDSIYAGLRRRRPDLTPYPLPKRTLVGLSHAIEDECCARAERPVLFGAFQRERFYRDAEPRWRELSRTAALAAVFADFDKERSPRGAPTELPLEREDPVGREWSLICDAPAYAACLSAWEIPGQDEDADLDRVFETIWTVEPELVREAASIAVGLAARTDAGLAQRAEDLLGDSPAPSGDDLQLVTALTSRMVAYVGAGLSGLPEPHA